MGNVYCCVSDNNRESFKEPRGKRPQERSSVRSSKADAKVGKYAGNHQALLSAIQHTEGSQSKKTYTDTEDLLVSEKFNDSVLGSEAPSDADSQQQDGTKKRTRRPQKADRESRIIDKTDPNARCFDSMVSVDSLRQSEDQPPTSKANIDRPPMVSSEKVQEPKTNQPQAMKNEETAPLVQKVTTEEKTHVEQAAKTENVSSNVINQEKSEPIQPEEKISQAIVQSESQDKPAAEESLLVPENLEASEPMEQPIEFQPPQSNPEEFAEPVVESQPVESHPEEIIELSEGNKPAESNGVELENAFDQQPEIQVDVNVVELEKSSAQPLESGENVQVEETGMKNAFEGELQATEKVTVSTGPNLNGFDLQDLGEAQNNDEKLPEIESKEDESTGNAEMNQVPLEEAKESEQDKTEQSDESSCKETLTETAQPEDNTEKEANAQESQPAQNQEDQDVKQENQEQANVEEVNTQQDEKSNEITEQGSQQQAKVQDEPETHVAQQEDSKEQQVEQPDFIAMLAKELGQNLPGNEEQKGNEDQKATSNPNEQEPQNTEKTIFVIEEAKTESISPTADTAISKSESSESNNLKQNIETATEVLSKSVIEETKQTSDATEPSEEPKTTRRAQRSKTTAKARVIYVPKGTEDSKVNIAPKTKTTNSKKPEPEAFNKKEAVKSKDVPTLEATSPKEFNSKPEEEKLTATPIDTQTGSRASLDENMREQLERPELVNTDARRGRKWVSEVLDLTPKNSLQKLEQIFGVSEENIIKPLKVKVDEDTFPPLGLPQEKEKVSTTPVARTRKQRTRFNTQFPSATQNNGMTQEGAASEGFIVSEEKEIVKEKEKEEEEEEIPVRKNRKFRRYPTTVKK